MKGTRMGTDQLAALGLTLVVASLTVGLLAVGCGKQEGAKVVAEQATSQPAPGNAVAAATAGTPQQAMTETTPPSADAAAPVDSMPPDVTASVSDDFVAPGDIVEITAEGTADVAEVTLTDARGKTQPLSYDSAMGIWKTHYRVPLKTSTDRLGLSLTAKNGFNCWRRVWVFINVQKLAVGADSTTN